MKKDIKVKDFSRVADEDHSNIRTVTWNELSVKIKKRMSTEEFNEIAKTVYSLCCHETTGEFVPENKEIAFIVMITNCMTNITLPKDVIAAYDLISGSSMYDLVKDEILTDRQIIELNNAIDSKIKYFIESKSSTITKTANDFVSKIENLAGAFRDSMEGVNIDDLNKALSAIVSAPNIENTIAESIVKNN